MKKHYETFGSDGKGNGRASNLDLLNEVLHGCLKGGKSRAWQCAYNLCRDVEEADELVQEACYRALKAGKSYESPDAAAAWLCVTLRNAFVDSRRRTERKHGWSLDYRDADGDGPLHEILPKNEEAVIEELLRQERAEAVRGALKRLGKDMRRVLMLCDMDGLSYEDAARKLGIPSGTLRSRLFRARRAVVRDVWIRRLA